MIFSLTQQKKYKLEQKQIRNQILTRNDNVYYTTICCIIFTEEQFTFAQAEAHEEANIWCFSHTFFKTINQCS